MHNVVIGRDVAIGVENHAGATPEHIRPRGNYAGKATFKRFDVGCSHSSALENHQYQNRGNSDSLHGAARQMLRGFATSVPHHPTLPGLLDGAT